MAKPKRWWNGRGFSQNWPQHFQVLGIIVKHHENSGVFEILPKELFGIQRSPNNSWKGSLRFPKGELYFPSETTRAKVCRLRWGIAWVSTFPVWALGSICDVLSLRVFIDIYIYIFVNIFTYTHAYYIHCNVWYCIVLYCTILSTVHVLYFHPCPKHMTNTVVGSFPREARRPSNSLLVPWRSLPWRSTDLGWVDPMLKWKMLYFVG